MCWHIYWEPYIVCPEWTTYTFDYITQEYTMVEWPCWHEPWELYVMCPDFWAFKYNYLSDEYYPTSVINPCTWASVSLIIENLLCENGDNYIFDYQNFNYVLNNSIIILPTPTNLKQYIQSPYFEKQEINLWEKVWKYQSWSGIILSADIYSNDIWKQLKFAFEIYKYSSNTPIDVQYATGIIIWSKEITLPYYWTWSFYWRVRTEDDLWNTSDWVNYWTDNQFETDYELFEWFEPYPYGYKFPNNWPSDWLLDGWISWLDPLNIGTRSIVEWRKWDIFREAFDLTWYDETRLMDAFENEWLNRADAFQWWNCYGMAVSTVMQLKHPEFLESYFSDFSSQVWDWYIWDKINSLSTSSGWAWDIYNDVSKMIYILQLSQDSLNSRLAIMNWYSSGTTILSKLTNNTSSSGYIIAFLWKDKEGNLAGHAVVPYKVEWNRIYVWDNNVPYPNIVYDKKEYKAYNQYIEVNIDWTWIVPFFSDRKSFDKISLIDINDIYNYWRKSVPSWFLAQELKYTLNWKSDLLVTDSEWRISWFSWWTILEEIPWVQVIVPLTDGLSWSTENTWKQIYLPQKQDLTVKVIAKWQENYDLMIAWWDYYTKLENVETSTWQIDSFESTVDNIKIDFDDTKTWSYNLLTDNFQENNTWTVYIENTPVIINSQEYDINWTEVNENTNNAVTQNIDTNNDGIFNWTWDIEINLPPVFQDTISPTTNYTLSWELLQNTTWTYIDKVDLTLNSQDNDEWSWVDKIYYAIWTDTWTLIYLPYTESITVNWIWNYTLNYYAIDKFWNIEQTKTINFSLVERPETYQWEISWYVYEDLNNNWVKDSIEKSMAWWKICIDLNNNNDCEESTEPFNLTNNDWYYDFNWLATWNYKILEIPHQNWILTNPTSKYYTIQLSNWQKVTNKDFWNLKTKGK